MKTVGRFEDFPFLAHCEQGVLHDPYRSVLTAYGDRITLGRSHHDSLNDGLAANKDFVIA